MHRYLGGAAALLVIVVVTIAVFHERDKSAAPDEAPIRTAPELPPISSSGFLNSAPAVKYVGTQACAKCHPGEHESYLQTAHSLSLSEVNPDVEPLDATFHHKASGRRYEVRRDGDQIMHRESLAVAADKLSILSEHIVKYLVGSGRHTRSYLIEDDGFFAESPVTWYASRQSWGMSPGYDQPQHLGFERAADTGCLFCHAGTYETIGQSQSRLKFHELAIGCERCHGAGALHVAKQKSPPAAPGAGDSTIVHPGRLPRERSESICAECHLRGNATVSVRGRRRSDFRPGLRLSDFRIDFHLDSGRSSMKVVGHVEQMRLSRCYQSSPTLTCTTCHDPHGTPAAEEKPAFFREKCLNCHPQSCRLPEAERRRRNLDDNCVACHMPQSKTDIPHIAFTHHRIGRHDSAENSGESDVAGTLIPFDGPKHLSAPDRERCLGLAYLELSNLTGNRNVSLDYRRRAVELLMKAVANGAGDGDVLAALARLHWEEDSPTASDLAARALRDENISPSALLVALFVSGDISLRQGAYAEAGKAFERLVQLRRHPEDWLLLGAAQAQSGQIDAALASLRRAVGISPFRADIHKNLAELLRRTPDTDGANRHEKLAERLSRHSPVKP